MHISLSCYSPWISLHRIEEPQAYMWYNNRESDKGFEANLELSYICMLVSIVLISFQWVRWTEFIFELKTCPQEKLTGRSHPFALTYGEVSFWRGWSSTPNHSLGKRSPVVGNLCRYGSSDESLIFHHRSYMTQAWPIRVAHFFWLGVTGQ